MSLLDFVENEIKEGEKDGLKDKISIFINITKDIKEENLTFFDKREVNQILQILQIFKEVMSQIKNLVNQQVSNETISEIKKNCKNYKQFVLDKIDVYYKNQIKLKNKESNDKDYSEFLYCLKEVNSKKEHEKIKFLIEKLKE